MNELGQPAPAPSSSPSSRGFFVGAAGCLALLTLLYLLLQFIGMEELQGTIAKAGLWGPLLFVAIKALTFTFAPLSAGPIQFASGLLFGVLPGTLYSLLGELIGGTINVLIARVFGRRIVQRFVGAAAMERLDGFYDRHLYDWKSLLAARLLLFSVYDFISYAVGFSHIRISVYIIVSFVGGLLPTLLFVLIGTEASQNQDLLLLLYLLAALAFVAFVIFRRQITRLAQMLRERTRSDR